MSKHFSKKFLKAVNKEPYISLLHIKSKDKKSWFLRVAKNKGTYYLFRKHFSVDFKAPFEALEKAVEFRNKKKLIK